MVPQPYSPKRAEAPSIGLRVDQADTTVITQDDVDAFRGRLRNLTRPIPSANFPAGRFENRKGRRAREAASRRIHQLRSA